MSYNYPQEQAPLMNNNSNDMYLNPMQPGQSAQTPMMQPGQPMMMQGAPQPGYAPNQMPYGAPGQPNFLVQTAAPQIVPRPIGEWPMAPLYVECPACHKAGWTQVSQNPSCGAWVCCILVFLIFCPLFWLPLIICKKNVHKCAYCHIYMN